MLKGKQAEDFIHMANENLKLKGSVDFSKQAETCANILKKAKFTTLSKEEVESDRSSAYDYMI